MSNVKKIIELAQQVFANEQPSSNTHQLVGSLLMLIADYLKSMPQGGISGYIYCKSESDFPQSPTDKEKRCGFVLNGNIYFYVGEGGDFSEGRYQNGGRYSGPDGKSAYEVAVENGFEGSVEEWLASLKEISDYENLMVESRPENPQTKIIYGIPAADGQSWTEEFWDGSKWVVLRIHNEQMSAGKFKTGEEVSNIGIDNKPKKDSNNLVKSGSIYELTNQLIEDELVKGQSNPVYTNPNYDLMVNIDDVIEEDTTITKIGFDKSNIDRATTRTDATFKVVILDNAFKITKIEEVTLGHDKYDIEVSIDVPAGYRIALQTMKIGTYDDNGTTKNVYNITQVSTASNASRWCYTSQIKNGFTLSNQYKAKAQNCFFYTSKVRKFIKEASDLPYDNSESGLKTTNVQDAIDEVSENTTTLNKFYEATNGKGISYLYEMVYSHEVNFEKDVIIKRIEFNKDHLNRVINRQDYNGAVFVCDSNNKITNIYTFVLPHNLYSVDVNISVKAGEHFGFVNNLIGKDSSDKDLYLLSTIDRYPDTTTLRCQRDYASQLKLNNYIRFEEKRNSLAGYTLYIQDTIKNTVEENSKNINDIKNSTIFNNVSYKDISFVVFMGSSLTDEYLSPKGMSWTGRLNDMVDINVHNGGISGSGMLSNAKRLLNNDNLYHSGDKRPSQITPKYIWFGNTTNGSSVTIAAIKDLDYAKCAAAQVGAQMLLGSEYGTSVYTDGRKVCVYAYKTWAISRNTPYSDSETIAAKTRIDAPYKGFSSGVHAGYRTTSSQLEHYNLLNRLYIDKSIKIFKVRPDYKEGNPTIEDLIYDNNSQRFVKFYAGEVGVSGFTDPSKCDNLDDIDSSSQQSVNPEPSSAIPSDAVKLRTGGSVSFNKFALLEIILNRVGITYGEFTVNIDKAPAHVYIATQPDKIYDSGSLGNYTTKWTEVTVYKYENGKLYFDIHREIPDMQMYDKVRIMVECDGEFNLSKPVFSNYNGTPKYSIDLLNSYHWRQRGQELNDKTSCEEGWTLNGGAEVRSLPLPIANYSLCNNVKKHIELPTDEANIKKVIHFDQPTQRIAVRVCANLYPKIATTRELNMTEEEKERYISTENPTVKNYGYNYGTLIVELGDVKVGSNIVGHPICQKFTMWPGWFDYYFEFELNENDTELPIYISRALSVDGYDTNNNFNVFIHNVSVQKID